MHILLLPVILLLGFPATIGAVKLVVKIYQLCTIRFGWKPQTGFVVSACIMAAMMSLFTAPYWLIGTTGWLVLSGIYVVLVGVGSPHTYRILVFFFRELDGDDSNDVPLPDAKDATRK